jgi:hypothetical protein
MKGVDLSPGAITARLREASQKSDLSPERRLDAKIDLSPAAITARLKEASDLRETCLKLAAIGAAAARRR